MTLRPLTKHPVTDVVKLLTLPLSLPSSAILLPHIPLSLPVLLSTISHHRIAEPQLVPPLIIHLAHCALISNYDLSCIKRFASSAAPISPSVLGKLEKEVSSKGAQAMVWDVGEHGVHHFASALGPRFQICEEGGTWSQIRA
jgi:4-coumarate--CoA ligase